MENEFGAIYKYNRHHIYKTEEHKVVDSSDNEFDNENTGPVQEG